MTVHRRKRTALELGQDAFLDIVANLVGVLIILVVVLGTQSQQAIEEALETEPLDAPASVVQMESIREQFAKADAAQSDSDRLERSIRQLEHTIDKRKSERAVLLDLLTTAKQAWEEAKLDQDAVSTELAARQTRYETLEAELEQLEGERQRIEGEPEPTVIVEHLPTPMAKTVFGDELHFRLKGNMLSVVPLERLIEETRNELQRNVQGSREGRLQSAVGPIRGYVARFEMDRAHEMLARGGRVNMATRIEVVSMKIEPLEEPIGQPIANVLSGRSELDVELAGRNPANTTITVWVYPDSFAAFRQLKEHLYRKGFATAARPLTMDRQIGVSPNGSRSTAQ